MASCPLAWDYIAAAIPSALTEDMEQHQEARAAEKKAKQRVISKLVSVHFDEVTTNDHGDIYAMK